MKRSLSFSLFLCSLYLLNACSPASSTPLAVGITATSGSGQSATVSKAFVAPLVASMTTGRMPTNGVAVTFISPATGASGTFANGTNTTTVTTGANGQASVAFSANGTAGSYTVTATAPGATAAANFNLTNTAGPAAEIMCASGSGQSVGINAAFGGPLVVQVADSQGNPVNDSGVVVTYTPPASGAGATFAGGINTATTNASGVATSATVSANGTTGAYTVMASATIAGVVKQCAFSLTNASQLVVPISGTPQSTAVNTAFPLPLAVRTSLGSDVGIRFTAPASGASGTFPNGTNMIVVTTGLRGEASTTFSANGTAGAYTVTAGVGGPPANFSLTNTAATVAASVRIQTEAQQGMHHHYKLIDLGTFGGPVSNVDAGGDSGTFSDEIGSTQGAFTGWADTSAPDPLIENPNFCFTGNCYVTRAFQWQNDVRKDLGVLQGGPSSATAWISANGLIAGTSQNGETDPLFSPWIEERAVLWQNGKIVDLGTLPEGGYESGAAAVNNSGQVTGWAINTIPDPYSFGAVSSTFFQYQFYGSYQTRAFLWQNGVMRDLGTLGGPDAFPLGINEVGQVIGFSYTSPTANSNNGCNLGVSPNAPTQDPFFWDHETGMIDLGSFGGTCGAPAGLNNLGQVVGYSNLAGDQIIHAFLWDRATGLVDLGTLGGSQAGAFAINDAGTVVGWSFLPGDNQLDAFLLGKNGLVDLGVLPGDNCAVPFWINLSGQVVGHGGTNCNGRGFLWENGGPLVDLNTLIVSSDGFSVTDASFINDQGEIIGTGIPAGCDDVCSHAYVLIPCDENHPNIEGCDFSLVDPPVVVEVRPRLAKETAAPSQFKFSPAEMMTRLRSPRAGGNRRSGTPQTSPQ